MVIIEENFNLTWRYKRRTPTFQRASQAEAYCIARGFDPERTRLRKLTDEKEIQHFRKYSLTHQRNAPKL